MSKEEIQKKIDQANLDIYATNQRISKLREEIAKAEKPKLGHGDFGYWIGPTYNDIKLEYIHILSDGKLRPASSIEYYADQITEDTKYSKLGNIFDLLKDDEFIKMLATLKRKQS